MYVIRGLPKTSELHTEVLHDKVKVKLKFTLEQATKAQRGSRVIVLLFP